MANDVGRKKLSDIFVKRTDKIELIFSSYKELYELYVNLMKTANINKNNQAAFENCKKTVDQRQKDISGELYTQAFILMTGTAEAFIKDVFEDLMQENFEKIKKSSGINYNISDVQKALEENEDREYMSLRLANLAIGQINNIKNAKEKINFQNIVSTKEAFLKYFGVTVDINADYMKRIHKSWQMRHAIIHTNSRVDERFITNVQKVGLLHEKLGDIVTITKETYTSAKNDFCVFFDGIQELLNGEGLHTEGIIQ